MHCEVATETSATPMSAIGSESHQQTAATLRTIPGPPGGTDGDVTQCGLLVYLPTFRDDDLYVPSSRVMDSERLGLLDPLRWDL